MIKNDNRIAKILNNIKTYFEIKYVRKDNIIPLSPRVIESEHTIEYLKELHAAIKNKELNNIAITGNYGTGKSSIIKTYLKKLRQKSKNYVTINIASYFKKENTKKSRLTKNRNKNEDTDNFILEHEELEVVDIIEKTIVRQILFKNKSESISESDIKRISGRRNRIIKKFSIFYVISSIFLYSIFIFFNKIKQLKNIVNSQSIIRYFQKNIPNIIIIITIRILLVLFIISIMVIIISLIKIIYNSCRKIILKIGNSEIIIGDNNDLAFARFQREIILFFSFNPTCKLVIFEDIDRYSKDITLKLIEELKRLNKEINRSDSVSQKVTFIYSFKDNIFDKVEDRSKFYDHIISIMPVSSFYNSKEILKNLLLERKNTKMPPESLIDILSSNVYDIRTLTTIVNDYNLFCNILKSTRYDKIFAIAIFKNCYFKDYENILNHDNIIEERFKTITSKQEDLIKEIRDDNSILYEKIDNIKNENVTKLSELKKLLWCSIPNLNPSKLFVNNNYYNYVDFIMDSFNMDELRNYDAYLDGHKVDYSYFDGKDSFFERIDMDSNERKSIIQTEIAENNIKINKIKELSKSEIFKEYIKTSEHDILDELIAIGSIENDYIDYLTAPSSSGMTGGDNKYIFDVRHNTYSFETNISNPKKVIDQLRGHLNSPYILNIFVLNFLHSSLEYRDEFISIIKQFKNLTNKKLAFLEILMKNNKKLFNYIIDSIADCDIDLWTLSESEEIDKFYLTMIFEATLTTSAINKIIDTEGFIEYATIYFNNRNESNRNILLKNEFVRKNISRKLKYKIRIKNIQEYDKNDQEFIIKNNLYQFNPINIKQIVGFVPMDLSSQSLRIPYGILFLAHIRNNFENFFREFYINNNVIINEKQIIEIALKSNLSVSEKLIIFKREKFKIPTTAIDKELYNDALKYDHIFPEWSNIVFLYRNVKDDMLNRYVVSYKNQLFIKTKIEDNYSIISGYINYISDLTLFLLENNYIKEAQLLTTLVLSKKKFKYYNAAYLKENTIINLCRWDLLDYNKNCLNKVLKISSELAAIHLNNWVTHNSYRTIFERIKKDVECMSIFLQNKKLNAESKIHMLTLSPLSQKEKRNLIKIAFSSTETSEIKNKNIYLSKIINNPLYEDLFKIIDINKDKIIFKLNS